MNGIENRKFSTQGRSTGFFLFGKIPTHCLGASVFQIHPTDGRTDGQTDRQTN